MATLFQSHHAIEKNFFRDDPLLRRLEAQGLIERDAPANRLYLPYEKDMAEAMDVSPHRGKTVSSYSALTNAELRRISTSPDGQAAMRGDEAALRRVAERVVELRDTIKVALIEGDLYATVPQNLSDEAAAAKNIATGRDLAGYRAAHIDQIAELRSMAPAESEWAMVTRSESRVATTLAAVRDGDTRLVRAPGEPPIREIAGRMEFNLAIDQATKAGRLTVDPANAALAKQLLVDDLPKIAPVPPRLQAMADVPPHQYRTLSQRGEIDADLLMPELTKGRVAIGVAVVAVSAMEAVPTAHGMARDWSQDNATAAEAKMLDFGFQSAGGVAGAVAGARLGALRGHPIIGGAVGGLVGYVGADALAKSEHERAIYNQKDSQGRRWTLDPDRPDEGWQRGEAVPDPNNRTRYGWQVHQADAAQTNELNFKASTTSLELTLGNPHRPRDPYSLPASGSDARSEPGTQYTAWTYQSGTGGWQRELQTTVDRGQTLTLRTEPASAERAAQLNAQSQQVIEANAALSAPVMAARFADAHRENGWAAHGPISPAIAHARNRDGELVASDGDRYVRQANGRWSSDEIGGSEATPLIQRELEATRQSAKRQADALDPLQQTREQAPLSKNASSDAPPKEPAPAMSPEGAVLETAKRAGAPMPKGSAADPAAAMPLTRIPPEHRDARMYEALRERLPESIPNDKVAEAAVAIRMAGLKTPEQLDLVRHRDDLIILRDKDAFSTAVVRTDTPAPSIETSLERSNAHRQDLDQFISQMQARDQAMQESQGMSMRIGARTMDGPGGDGAAAGGGDGGGG